MHFINLRDWIWFCYAFNRLKISANYSCVIWSRFCFNLLIFLLIFRLCLAHTLWPSSVCARTQARSDWNIDFLIWKKTMFFCSDNWNRKNERIPFVQELFVWPTFLCFLFLSCSIEFDTKTNLTLNVESSSSKSTLTTFSYSLSMCLMQLISVVSYAHTQSIVSCVTIFFFPSLCINHKFRVAFIIWSVTTKNKPMACVRAECQYVCRRPLVGGRFIIFAISAPTIRSQNKNDFPFFFDFMCAAHWTRNFDRIVGSLKLVLFLFHNNCFSWEWNCNWKQSKAN